MFGWRDLRGPGWLRALIPGNPEGATSRDLRRRGLDREMRESGLEVIGRYTTMPEWIEAFLARPKRP